MLEKEINLQIAQKLQSYLEQSGSVVLLTRNSDAALGDKKISDMRERKNIANDTGASVIISIHQNSYTSENAKGTQVFYYNKSAASKALADSIQDEIQSLTGQNKDRKSKENGSYYILKKTDIPAVIVECGFLSNTRDTELLQNEEYQWKMAWAIYRGILGYFENTEKTGV
ncbi:hypothetical protein FACS1894188_00650 [Clostridia bacterium]|nr:hypothetical protein FACS1894188_00650 [Clostridia bacterium]